ncbi:DUF3168 domain-containing protein [Flexibacterium corallicola]|uniref:DUF3168 domain-containing protein n=1 Tax=Flexibacterium corallicola TaxID=3037259 RepID=UPI00286F14E6|nr:DUF3168 domain-containing protein [Pseudovibrio sp. M1P-2-3]
MSVTAFRASLFAKLNSGGATPASLGDPPRIYDGAPRHVALPYASLALVEERHLTGNSMEGVQIAFSIGVYSQKPSREELQEIARWIIAVLTEGRVFAADGSSGFVLVESQSSDLMRDRKTWRGLIRFKGYFEPSFEE